MAKKSVKKRKSTKKISKKALKDLISKGKKQGYLTYDEINKALPDAMLSLEQIDDTLIMFDDHDIEIIDEKKSSLVSKTKKTEDKKITISDTSSADFGTVTDPVKMYLREMGLVTLLSREGEVEIAKKIEAGEQEVLRALLDTTIGVDCIVELGEHIQNGVLRPKHVLRDIRDIEEGYTYVDEALQIENFIGAITKIRAIDKENTAYRENKTFLRLISIRMSSAE